MFGLPLDSHSVFIQTLWPEFTINCADMPVTGRNNKHNMRFEMQFPFENHSILSNETLCSGVSWGSSSSLSSSSSS